MKLVELLARELDVWPEGVVQLTQSVVDREVYDAGEDGLDQELLSPNRYLSAFHSEDTEYPTVTRADWQAERERIAGKAAIKQQQPEQDQEEMTPAHTEYNPIHTRNRILEIDRTTEALEEERGQLVQRLADEGFVLARVDGKVVADTVDNLPRDQWSIGDLVIRVQEGAESAMPTGTPLPITYFDGSTGGRDVLVDDQFYPSVSSLIWHSRPTA